MVRNSWCHGGTPRAVHDEGVDPGPPVPGPERSPGDFGLHAEVAEEASTWYKADGEVPAGAGRFWADERRKARCFWEKARGFGARSPAKSWSVGETSEPLEFESRISNSNCCTEGFRLQHQV